MRDWTIFAIKAQLMGWTHQDFMRVEGEDHDIYDEAKDDWFSLMGRRTPYDGGHEFMKFLEHKNLITERGIFGYVLPAYIAYLALSQFFPKEFQEFKERFHAKT